MLLSTMSLKTCEHRSSIVLVSGRKRSLSRISVGIPVINALETLLVFPPVLSVQVKYAKPMFVKFVKSSGGSLD